MNKKRYVVKLKDNEDFSTKTIKCNNLFEFVKKLDPFDYVQKTFKCETLDELLDKGVQFQYEESGFSTIDEFYSYTMIDQFVEFVKSGDIMSLDGEFVDSWTDVCIIDTESN